jgi:hypothetical protein
MKVTAEKSFGKWSVSITQGHQVFHLFHGGTESEARWMASMFRIALQNHDTEIIERTIRTIHRRNRRKKENLDN